MSEHKKTLFIVDDEEKIVAILDKYARAEGFSTECFYTGAGIIDSVKQREPNAILLDVMLPDQSGIELCKSIRQFSQVPILMVSAKVDEIDRLLGLELGADDYICKPFSPREVMARIKTVLRRHSHQAHSQPLGSTNPAKVYSGLYLEPNRYSAQFNGQALTLTPVEFRILDALAELPHRPWNRNQLIGRMYSDNRHVSDRTVDSHIANLRKKLQAFCPESECIQSIYGVGYRLENLH